MRFVVVAVAGVLAVAHAYAQEARFDGDYGNPEGTMGTGSACGTTRFGSRITVRNGQAALRTVTQGPLEGPVHADGTVEIIHGRATLRGRIDGSKFTGTLSIGNQCQFALDYKRL